MPSSRRSLLLGLAALSAAGPAWALPFRRERRPFEDIDYAVWTDDEPEYRLYPGDEIDIAVPSAPELNRTVKVQPDGRVAMPLIDPVMAADRTAPELEAVLGQAYATVLRRPEAQVSLKQAAPIRVFVGGEVGTPGVYEMTGDIDALQAVIMAGGFRPSARGRAVVVVRRNPRGQAMIRTVNLDRALGDAHADRVPLRRFDIVYVPRSSLAEVGRFVSQIRDALPFSFSYNLGEPFQ